MTPMPNSLDTPLITVVIPTFNRCVLLQRALKSVQSQSYRNWLMLVVDNASTDATESVVKDFMSDARIGYVRQPRNIGMLANWAFAISAVATDYFCVLSDDDIVLPEFLISTLEALQADPQLGMCFGSTSCVDFSGDIHCLAPSNMPVGYYPAGQGAAAMVDGQHPSSTGVLFRTNCVQCVGGFNTEAHYLGDVDMMLRVAMDFPIRYLGYEVAFHLVHAGNAHNDVSCWFPGLVAVFQGIERNQHVDPACRREMFDRLICTAIIPTLRSFVRHPFASYRAQTRSDVFKCLRLSRRVMPVLLCRLPILIARDAMNFVKRRIAATFRLPTVVAPHHTYRIKHPRASEYFS
jgi:glycosyltransferase involved in cell wall biosynthesis